MSAPDWNPALVERRIGEIVRSISELVSECDKRYRIFLEADMAFDAAFARAYLTYEGPQTEKKIAATDATIPEREARDVADAAYRYVQNRSQALRDELSAMQSVSRSVQSSYSVVGVS